MLMSLDSRARSWIIQYITTFGRSAHFCRTRSSHVRGRLRTPYFMPDHELLAFDVADCHWSS